MSLSRAAGQRPIRGLLLETHDDYLDLAMRAIYCFVYTGANYADVQHEMKLSSEFTNNSLDLQVLTSGYGYISHSCHPDSMFTHLILNEYRRTPELCALCLETDARGFKNRCVQGERGVKIQPHFVPTSQNDMHHCDFLRGTVGRLSSVYSRTKTG